MTTSPETRHPPEESLQDKLSQLQAELKMAEALHEQLEKYHDFNSFNREFHKDFGDRMVAFRTNLLSWMLFQQQMIEVLQLEVSHQEQASKGK